MICFKCQESAIIAHEFKNKCLSYLKDLQEKREDTKKLDDFDDIISFEGDGIEEEFDMTIVNANELNAIEINGSCEENNDFSNLFYEEEIESAEEIIITEEIIEEDDNFELLTSDNKYQCKLCESSYKTKDNLRRHLIRHKTTSKLNCHYCPRQFCFQRELNFHLKQHLEPQLQYQCQICSKNYSSNSALKKHMVLHTDNSKQFKCTFEGCMKAFRKKFTLQNHMHTHESAMNKPLNCTMKDCIQSFIQKSELKRHMRTCHGEKFYKCEYCKAESFDKKGELRVHWIECEDFLNSRIQ